MNDLKEEIRNALIAELKESYGGLSTDKEGNELNTPYLVLGIFEAAWERLETSKQKRDE
jgi:hypothetical protein